MTLSTLPQRHSGFDHGIDSSRGAPAWQEQVFRKIAADDLARKLAWFGIGLGLAELFAPAFVARIAGGSGRHTGLLRLYGVREITSSVAIFAQGRRPAGAMWSRVAGDAMDLATLGLAFASRRTNRAAAAFATANVLGITALDLACARKLSHETGAMTADGALRMKRSVAINKPREEIYAFWRDLANLPRFMYHLESVQPTSDNLSHWVTKAPAGRRVEWDAEIVADRPNEMIAWRSLQGADVYNSGAVHFEPRAGGRGTTVRVELEYRPPGGMAGRIFAMVFNQSPEQQIHDDLRRLKQVLETGEVLRSDASRKGAGQVLQHPGRPAEGPATYATNTTGAAQP
jgi:uncharacterized membrane protein